MIDIQNLAPKTNVTVILTDGTVLDGMFTGLSSKGATFKVGSRVTTRSLNKIAEVRIPADVDTPADLFADDATYTTAEVAAALDMSAYDLRVHLRGMGMGVGKGHTYGFDATEARRIVASVKGDN